MAYIRPASQGEITAGTSLDTVVTPKLLYDNVWFLDGNPLAGVKNFGTTTAIPLPFVINSSEMMRLTSTGLGVGTNSPNVRLEVDSGTANVSGFRLTNLTSASPSSTGLPVGVDASGNLVRVNVITEAIQSFTVSGDTGSPQFIIDGETVSFVGGTGISTATSSGNVVTLNFDGVLNDLTDVTISSPTTNHFLFHNGTTWVNSLIPIDKLSDVDTTTVAPISGQTLQFNGTNWVPATISAGGTSFTLSGNTGTGQIIGGGDTLKIAGGLGIDSVVGATDTVTLSLNATIDNLSDVVITSAASGQTLQYNGTNWINTNSVSGTVTAVTASDSVDIDFTLTNPNTVPNFTAVLQPTAVSAASYGSATQVGTFTVDSKGRLTAAANTAIAIAASQVTSGTFVDARIAQSNVTQHQAALTILETQITDGSLLARVGGNETITGTWAFNNVITASTAPTLGGHLTNKTYVDGLIANQRKTSVRVATTANGTLATAFENGDTIDGVTLVTGDRILIKNQSSQGENGVYTVNASGAPTRATDMDSAAEVDGTFIIVEDGTTLAGTIWLTVSEVTTLGTDAIVFTQINKATDIIAGAGLTLTSLTLDIGTASSSRIVVNANDIDLATTAVSAASYGSASSVPTFTVDAYGRLTAASNTTIAFSINQLTDVDTATVSPSSGQTLQFNGSNWVPSNVIVQGASNGLTLSGTNIILGGTLTQNTTITQGSNNLNFNLNSTGKLGVNVATPLSGLDVNTSVSTGAITTVTGNATLDATNYMVLVDNASNAVITLPAAASVTRREYVVKKISTNSATVTIDPNGSELIDGAATYTLNSSYVSIKLKSDGTSWYIL